MAALVVELALFLNAYVVLFAMLAVRFTPVWLIATCAGFALLGLASGIAVIRRFRRVTAYPWKLVAVEDRGTEVAGFLATYLLPLLTIAEPSARDLIAYGLFLAVTAVVYLRSGLVRVNPTLYLLGWRLHAVQIGDSAWSGFVLARRELRAGEEFDGIRLTERIFLSE